MSCAIESTVSVVKQPRPEISSHCIEDAPASPYDLPVGSNTGKQTSNPSNTIGTVLVLTRQTESTTALILLNDCECSAPVRGDRVTISAGIAWPATEGIVINSVSMRLFCRIEI